MIRTNVSVKIVPALFFGFNKHQEIVQLVPASYQLRKGQKVGWECAHLNGTLEVLKTEPFRITGYVQCTLQKLS